MEPTVTDHALVRYMERVMELDLDAIRAQILTPANVVKIKAIRNGRIPVGNWSDLVVVEGRVLTVAPRNHESKNAPKPKRK